MGRRAIIDRENLLDIAEALVRREGAGALTIGGLAAAAGITKGGVQYNFPAKEDLVRGLVDRWSAQFDAILDMSDGSPLDFIRQYIAMTRASGDLIDSKIAAVMMTYMRDPQNLKAARDWYQGIMTKLAGDSQEAQLARILFLALEGLFLMRVNAIDDEINWEDFIRDIEDMLTRFLSSPAR